MKLTWSANAVSEFKSAISYIRRDSDQNADKVKLQILAKVERLTNGNIIHRKDRTKMITKATFVISLF